MPQQIKHKILCLAFSGISTLSNTAYAVEDIRPGLWKISMQSGVENTPDWKPEPFTLTQCLTESDAQNPDRLLLGMGSTGASSCDLQNRHYSGNTLSFQFSCAGTLGMTGSGQVTFSATQLEGSLTVSLGGDSKISMQNQIRASFQGECPAKSDGLP